MIPPRIKHGDPIGKLVDYWNILIDHLNETRLVSGRGINISKMPAGTIISTHIKATSGQTGGTVGYNGYFAIKPLAQTEDELQLNIVRVAVCDGATWKSDTQSSAQSLAYINAGIPYWVDCKVVAVTPELRYILLRYDYAKNSLSIVSASSAEDSFAEYKNYIIGEVVFEDDIFKIIQRHGNAFSTNGAAYLWVIANSCMIGTDEEIQDD